MARNLAKKASLIIYMHKHLYKLLIKVNITHVHRSLYYTMLRESNHKVLMYSYVFEHNFSL